MIKFEIITPETVLLVESDNLQVNLPLTTGEYEVRPNGRNEDLIIQQSVGYLVLACFVLFKKTTW